MLWHSRKVKNRMIPLRKLHLLPYGSNAGSDFLKCAINKEKHSQNRGFRVLLGLVTRLEHALVDWGCTGVNDNA